MNDQKKMGKTREGMFVKKWKDEEDRKGRRIQNGNYIDAAKK